ncbi:MAG: serine hydroxymethyltransferase [Nanoarchaeota archaeon]|nr:serine hydroxymethyltransferase [Nanoarchaeota archaeon]MBU1005216.1 serine hydroxymethyltransferase [Nanoarchaeota archaeon]MBU1946887.1 serine hydroxymethyltransferase [Nanoarchaeota archaeon]
MLESLKKQDSVVYNLVKSEINRQKNGLCMIPSENHASVAVLEAMGTPLSNKYSEGYPGKRYYTGNQFIDQIENLAIERAKKLFKADHANVQPNAGSTANQAVYFAMLNVGDKAMGMDLSHGGHLTHGSPVNFSGKLYNMIHYGVEKDTERINYDKLAELAHKEKPKMIISGATAYPREIDFDKFTKIAHEIGAVHLADVSHIVGLILGGVHKDCSSADIVMTTTHKTLRGPRSAIILCKEKFAKQIDKAVFPGLQGGPMEHVIAAKAVCFEEAMKPDFKPYQEQIKKNAAILAKVLGDNGIRIISRGTDNHLVLIDATSVGITGKIGSTALEEAGIYTNRNTIPFETRSPFDPSGIRMGTPSLTTRGMKEGEMEQAGEFITSVLKDPGNADLKKGIRKNVEKLTVEFPIYKEFD